MTSIFDPPSGPRHEADHASDDSLTFDEPGHRGPAFAAAGTTTTAAQDDDAPDDAPDDDPIDDEFAPRPRAKLGVLTRILALVVIVGLGFLAGVYVQKHHGATASAAGAGTGAQAAAARAFAGGFAGRGGAAAGPGGTGATGGGTTTATPATPAVIGKIAKISGRTVTVRNLGGKSITVHLAAGTTVTAPVSSPTLKAGQTVAVVGKTGTDGSVSATAITVQ